MTMECDVADGKDVEERIKLFEYFMVEFEGTELYREFQKEGREKLEYEAARYALLQMDRLENNEISVPDNIGEIVSRCRH